MKAKIERNIVRINGADIEHYTAKDRSDLLLGLETEIKGLEALEFKTDETLDRIKELRENAKEVLAVFNEDYARRKAAAEKA